MNKKHGKTLICAAIAVGCIPILYSKSPFIKEQINQYAQGLSNNIQTINDIPDFCGNAYVEVNGNIPYFTEDELTVISFEEYAPFDFLGRCQVAYACLGMDTLPTAEREPIGEIKPTGWHTVQYPDLIEDRYLYNRCHLIAYELSGENANPYNLITGTRYMNISGMLPFENMTANYIRSTGNHVMYRVTPDFHSLEMVCRGVLIEACSVEDTGAGICFCIYCYNFQPGITINYLTGDSNPLMN